MIYAESLPWLRGQLDYSKLRAGNLNEIWIKFSTFYVLYPCNTKNKELRQVSSHERKNYSHHHSIDHDVFISLSRHRYS